MDRSSMSFAELRNSIIAARDRRQELLDGYLGGGCRATVTLSLNIPGADKNPPEAGALFSWALRGLAEALPGVADLHAAGDALGPYAVMAVNLEAAEVKRRCITLESARPFARLLDLDVYDQSGGQVGRASLGLAPRPCLVCGLPAVDCIRLRRHSAEQVTGRADELLAHFRG